MSSASWVSQLKKTLPNGVVKTDLPTLRAHSGDAWLASHLPEVVVEARSTEDVRWTASFASQHQIPLTARGAGRGYVGGCVPVQGGISLSLMKMNRILELSKTDSVAVVQPGVITGDIHRAAKELGLFYPPDPASLDESSIGGNIATNAGGPRCLKYGVTRNFVLGLEVVLANGEVIRTGGRTLKNKAGFDLVSLFVGSEGMLGIVTEATLRLIPHPPSRSALTATFAHASDAVKLFDLLQEHGLIPAAFEIADAFTMSAARKVNPRLPKGDAWVFIEMDGQKISAEAEISVAEKLAKKCHALYSKRADGDAACEKLWRIRRGLSQGLKSTGLIKLNEDVAVPRGRLLDLFQFAEHMQKKTGFPVACFGHAGDGNIHVNIMVPSNSLPNDHQHVLDMLFERILAWGGAITGEHGIGLAKKRWWPQAISPSVQHIHQVLKRALDPHHILNPGKFLTPESSQNKLKLTRDH